MPNAIELGAEWLAERFRKACRRPKERKIGLEVERIGLFQDGNSFAYSDRPNKPGAGTLLTTLASHHGWKVGTSPEGRPLYLTGPVGKVSLEPGSQLELSAAPDPNLISLSKTIDTFERQVDAITRPWGLHWIPLGVNPVGTVPQVELIPSSRYHIMTEYLGKRARLGTSMMRLTSSVQINLDYTSEAEAIEMLRTALAAAPVSYALFGNSPIAAKQSTGQLSYRQRIWKETDPDRTGLIPEAFQPGFGFDEYAKLAWNRPLMFAQTPDSRYLAAEGTSVADIAAGKLPGTLLTEANLTNSIQELFFEARLKPGYVEIRSLDGQAPADRNAAAAFWVGLLYRPEARRLALDLLGGLTARARDRLLDEAGEKGMAAIAETFVISDMARRLADAAGDTLVKRGQGEEKLLEPVFETLRTGKNPGARQLEKFEAQGRPWSPAAITALFS